MTSKNTHKHHISTSLKSIANAQDLADEIEDLSLSDQAHKESYEDNEYESESGTELRGSILNLSTIAPSEWDAIAVSPDSTFKMNRWDFTAYPHVSAKGARINFDYVNSHGVNLDDPEFIHWLRISKALILYQVPHFGSLTRARSYGHMASTKTKVLRLVQLFKAEGLYLGRPGSTKYRTLDDLSTETVLQFIDSLDTPGKKWEFAWTLQFWQEVSSSGLLPEQYSVHEKHVSKNFVSKARADYDNAASPQRYVSSLFTPWAWFGR